jgi:hypothetical protein
MPPSASDRILKRINDVVRGFGIYHTTIQFEHLPCVVSDNGCQMRCAGVKAHVHDGHTHHDHVH